MTITKCRGLFALISSKNPFLWKREAKQQSPAVAKKKIKLELIIMVITIIDV